MLKKHSLSLVLAGLLLASGLMAIHAPAYARMPEPSTVPAALQGTSPHTPTVSRYYLDELVHQGKMTKSEAEKTQQYLVFRHKRRQQDLKNIAGLDEEARRQYMAAHRRERGNPLKEYADFCGFTYERTRDLMNVEHDSDKGTHYYQLLFKAN